MSRPKLPQPADLHVHTTFCDGKSTAEEIVLCAIGKGFPFSAFPDMRRCRLRRIGV